MHIGHCEVSLLRWVRPGRRASGLALLAAPRRRLWTVRAARTRPVDSPSGPSTTMPASRAAYTLLTAAMTARVGVNAWMKFWGLRIGRAEHAFRCPAAVSR